MIQQQGCGSNAVSRSVFERVACFDLSSLEPEDDLSPHLPLLCRIAQQHDGNPSERHPYPLLGELLHAYPGADRVREYVGVDWSAVLSPVVGELDKTVTEGQGAPGLAASLGDSLISEFERKHHAERMSLLLSELGRVTAEGSCATSDLLSDKGLEDEICIMLPIAYSRCSRYLHMGSMLHGLSGVDHEHSLMLSLFNNVPGLVSRVIPILVSAASRFLPWQPPNTTLPPFSFSPFLVLFETWCWHALLANKLTVMSKYLQVFGRGA